MQITGKVTRKSKVIQVWQNNTDKIEITVAEQTDKYPNDVNFTLWKDKAKEADLDIDLGDIITVKLNISTTEHNDRIYNNISWFITGIEKSDDVQLDTPF